MNRISEKSTRIDFEAAEILDYSSLKKIGIKEVNPALDGNWVSYSGENRLESISLLRSCQDSSLNILLVPPVFKKLETSLLRQLNSCYPEGRSLIAFCSSGSSGVPKVIVHTFDKLIESANNLITHYPNIKNGVTYSSFPFFYMAGILNNLIVPLLAQSVVVLDKAFDFSSAFRISSLFERISIDWAWLSPGMINSIVSSNRKLSNSLTLKFILSATGPLRQLRRNQASEYFRCDVLNTYGLTELLFVSGEWQASNDISLGKPIKGCDLRLENHEVQIRTNTLCEQIFKLEKGRLIPTKLEFTPDKWVRTNDIGIPSSAGIQLTGRNDDIAILHGENVSLNLIEEVAESFDLVLASCARISPEGTSDILELFVELRIETDDAKSALRQHLIANLPLHWLPSKISIKELPRLASGKIDRRCIREKSWP
jgi:long-chain acyl-CoA synthetase